MKVVRRTCWRTELDDVVWSTDRRYPVIGTTIRVLSTDVGVADHAHQLLEQFGTTELGARTVNTIRVARLSDDATSLLRGCGTVAASADSAELVAPLIGAVNEAALASCPSFAVHAGVVALGDRVVVIPGPSGGGKSTLTAACQLTGFGYVSDEALVLDDDGTVVSYPKPLALTRWSCETLGIEPQDPERLLAANELGPVANGSRKAVTHILLTTFGGGPASLWEATPSEAVAALITYSFNHYRNPARAFHLATATARQARVWHMEYGDPMQAARLLHDRLA